MARYKNSFEVIRTIATIKKNQNEVIKINVVLNKFTDKTYYDIRVYYYDPTSGYETATKKGITVSPAVLLEILKILTDEMNGKNKEKKDGKKSKRKS